MLGKVRRILKNLVYDAYTHADEFKEYDADELDVLLDANARRIYDAIKQRESE